MSEAQALERIKHDVENNPVCLFMKGTPEAPQCGFSAQVVMVLNEHQVPFHSVDVLQDWDVREGVKKFANWKTIPQLYVNGKFIGGCEITMKLHRDGELQNIFDAVKQ